MADSDRQTDSWGCQNHREKERKGKGYENKLTLPDKFFNIIMIFIILIITKKINKINNINNINIIYIIIINILLI